MNLNVPAATTPAMNNAHFWEHVEELRKAFIKSFAVVVLGTLLIFAFFPSFFSGFTEPLHNLEEQPLEYVRITNRGSQEKFLKGRILQPGESLLIEREKKPLILLSPLEGISTSLKASFWLSLAFTYPLWAYFFFRFISPGLSAQEKKFGKAFLVTSCFSLTLGSTLGYFFVIHPLSSLFAELNSPLGDNMWTVQGALAFELYVLVACCLVIELASSLLLLVHYGLISHSTLSTYRRIIYVALFVLGAAITPPDVLTQLGVALPLLCIFELSLLYAKLRYSIAERNRKRSLSNEHLSTT